LPYSCAVLFLAAWSLFAQKDQLADLTKQLEELENPPLARPTDYLLVSDWDTLQVKLRKARFLIRSYQLSGVLEEAVGLELKQAREIIAAQKKQLAIPLKAGIREEGYYSVIDGSYQPFMRFLPGSYNGKKKIPLIVHLHGYSPYYNIANWSVFPEGLPELAEKIGFAAVMPFGRSNTDFQSIGEHDVLNVLEHMCRRYQIDRDRIILCGLSMGGMGVWTIAGHYPHLFAGLLVISGRGDYYFWHQRKREQFPPYKQLLVDTEFGATLLPNLEHLPIRSFHGEADELVKVEEARHFYQLLSKLNPDFKQVEIPDGDHWIYDLIFARKDVAEWLPRCRREIPRNFTYVSYHPRYNQAYWLQITGWQQKQIPRKVKVNVTDSKIEITGDGVNALLADRNRLPKAWQKLPIKAKGIKVTEGEIPTPAKAYPWGPVKDAFLQPFILVAGGAAKGQYPQNFFGRIREWYLYAKSLPRIKTEAELTPELKENFNLFLFGEPEQSAMIRQALEKCPVKVEKEHYVVGKRRFPRRGNGLIVKYPSPWNPARSVVIQCGIAWGEGVSSNHLYDNIPGYIIYSPDADQDDPEGSNRALCAGFFDDQGQLATEWMYVPKE